MNFGQWVGFIILIISLYILWHTRQLILLLFAAVILATALNFLVRKIQIWVKIIGIKLRKNWKIKRGYAVSLSIILFLAIVAGFILVIVPPFTSQFQDLTKLFVQAINTLNLSLNRFAINLSPLMQDALPTLQEILAKLQPLINDLLNQGTTVVFNSIGAVLNSILLLALTLMFLTDPQPYRQGFLRLFPAFYRRRVNQIISICEHSLEDLITRVLINILIISLASYLSLLILGIPLPLAQGMLAGILTFIPYMGPLISVIFPVLISLIESSWKFWIIILIYFSIYQFKHNIILPKLGYQENIILPGIMLLSQLFFATFFGFLGLLIALPLTIIGKILFKEILIKDILNTWTLSSQDST